MRHFSAVQ
jgi:large subunit ribosomal protein L22